MGDKIFLFLDNIPGTSTDTNHVGWIQIHSIHFESRRDIKFKLHVEDTAPTSSVPTLSYIKITKPSCVASPQLFLHSNTLQMTKLIIDVVHEKVGDGVLAEGGIGSGSTRYESDECWVSSFEVNGGEGLSLFETITFAVTSLTMTHNPPINSADKKTSSGYHYQLQKRL